MAGKTTILFDFWGTLVEQGTKSPLRQTYNFLRPRLDFSEFVEQFENAFMLKEYKDLNEAFESVLESFGMTPRPDIIEKLIGVWNKNWLFAQPYPDTKECLERLKKEGYTLGLVSNTQIQSVEKVLEKHDLEKYFDTLALSYKEGKLKTTGELITIALQRLRKKTEDVVFIGDSEETDIRGAERAKVTPILIDRRGTRPEHSQRIESLDEIPQAIP